MLNISAGGFANNAAPTLRNIERINNSELVNTLDLSSVTGVQEIWNTGATGFYSNANLATVFGVSNVASTVTVDYAGALAGTSDIAKFAVSGSGATIGALTVASADAAAIDGVVLNVTGAVANTATLTALTGLKSIVVEGAGNISIGNGAVVTGLKTFDASAATGTVGYTSGATTGAVTVTGGSKADTLNFVAATATSKVTVDAGAGNDVITVGAGGSNVKGGAGADAITLGGGVDTVVYSAQGDSTYTNFDALTAFTTGTDKIDLTAFGLTAQTTAIVAATTSQTAIGGLSNGVDGFFGTDKVVSFTDGTKVYLFADLNGDGNFSAGADLVILTGVVAIGDIVFA